MAEWLKALAWKACIPLPVSWVRIPLSPPILNTPINKGPGNGDEAKDIHSIVTTGKRPERMSPFRSRPPSPKSCWRSRTITRRTSFGPGTARKKASRRIGRNTTFPRSSRRPILRAVMMSHRLRDTFAVDLLEKGVPLEEVSKLFGHESIKTTERHYAKWVRGGKTDWTLSPRRGICDTWVALPGILARGHHRASSRFQRERFDNSEHIEWDNCPVLAGIANHNMCFAITGVYAGRPRSVTYLP